MLTGEIAATATANRRGGCGEVSTLQAATAVWLALVALSVPGPQRQKCWLVVPADKRAGAIYHQAPRALTAAGFDVSVQRPQGASPDVVIVYPRALDGEIDVSDVLAASDAGAGLVVIYSSDLNAFRSALLEPWRGRLVAADAETARVDLVDHPITRGLENIFIWRVPATIKGLRPLIRQGRNIIAAHATRDGRRLVVLPLDGVVPGQAGDIIPPPNMRLLVQAALWAAGAGGVVAESPPSPSEPPTAQEAPSPEPQRPRGAYRPLAYLDMPADDEDWPEIHAAVANLLQALGLEVRDVRIPRRPKQAAERKAREPQPARRLPLIAALKDNPALVVVGSCRRFEEAEQVATVAYVEAGGALLALPRATNRTNDRLVWLNELLVDFGLGATLARGRGTAVPVARIAAQEVRQIGKIPDGVRVFGVRTTPWVVVDGVPVAMAQRFGDGKVGVLDPLPLVKAGAECTRAAWGKLTMRMVRYLIAGMKLQ